MASFKHNKKRNSGLVYEFLVRRVANQMIDQDPRGCSRALEILKKYFSEGQPLAEERKLFEAIRTTRGVPEMVARKVLAQVQRHASKLDRKKLEIKKSNLIKEINYSFGQDFFTVHRIPDYRLLASIHMFLDEGGQALDESVQKIQIEEALVKYMTVPEASKNSQGISEVDQLACALAAKKFQEKYGTTLNRDQKVLIEKYMRAQMSGDSSKIEEFIQNERSRIALILNRAKPMQEFRQDKVMSERLDEASRHLKDSLVACSLDEKVEDLMLYYKLTEELASDE